MKTATIATLLLVLALPAARPALAQRFTQTNLISDVPGKAALVDTNLVNPWGLVPSAGGVFWASNNVTSTSTLYQPNGAIVPLVVTIPGGAPTGVVATSAGDSAFDIPNGATTARAAFIFVSLNGNISAWSPAVNQTHAILVATDSGAVYTGAALGNTAVNPRLYVADFAHGAIDVYDSSFAEPKTNGSFTDPNLPPGYFPFNIANVGGQLYVMYAQHSATGDEQPGPGLGVVSVFDFEGNFVRRFTTGGELNAPWAAVQAPASFGPFSGDVLVGNFGDGRILAFDANGAFQGALKDSVGNTLFIERVWGLAFGRAASGAEVARRLYFAAGIADESHGLFGYLAATPSDTTTPPPPPVACDNRSKGAGFWRKLCGGPMNDHGHGHGDSPFGLGKGHGDGHDGGDSKEHGSGVGSDSLDVLFSCVTSNAAPNAFGAGGCFTAGCDLLRKVGDRTDNERAAQVLLLTRLNLCSGAVCDSLAIACGESRDGLTVRTVGSVADSLDILLCSNGNAADIRNLVDLLGCVMDSEGGDDQGDDNDQGDNVQRIAVKTLGTNPTRLTDGPVHFDVNAAAPSMVQLRIYDVRGRLVAEPMHTSMVVGSANVTWDGRDLRGRSVSPGTYFYRAVAAGQSATGRLLIVR